MDNKNAVVENAKFEPAAPKKKGAAPKKKSADPKKRRPLLLAYLIVGAVLLVVLIAATVIAEPWVKPIEAEQPNPPAEETLAAVKATEGEKIAIEIPLADNEAIKSAEGASIEDGGVFFDAKSAGENTVTVVTEEKEGPKAPETNFFGRLRALLRGVLGIAPDAYRTEKAEIASYTIPITVTAAEPQEAQGDALALDFEENPSAILVFNEIPNVTVADGSVAKATVVGHTVVVKPVGEEGGETTIEITADGKKTTYSITVAAKPEDKPTGGSSGSSSRPSGGSSGSSPKPSGNSQSSSSQSSNNQSSSTPATPTVTIAEVTAYVKAYAAQIGMTWDNTLTKDNASWGIDTGIPVGMSEAEWKERVRGTMNMLYSERRYSISALVHFNSTGEAIFVEYLY